MTGPSKSGTCNRRASPICGDRVGDRTPFRSVTKCGYGETWGEIRRISCSLEASKWRTAASCFRAGRSKAPNDRNKVTASADKEYSYAQVNADHPFDISGPWRNNYKFKLTVDDLEPKPTPFTAEGKRVFESTEQWQDAVLRCMPLGLPRVFGSPYAMDIVDAGNHYQVVHVQNNTARRIWMDSRKAPDDQPVTSTGFSSGRWDGDVLLIETTHLSPGTLDGSLLPMVRSGHQDGRTLGVQRRSIVHGSRDDHP